MVGRFRGIITEKRPPLVLIKVGDVDYEARTLTACFYKLPEAGQGAIVFAHFAVHEDAQLLYGSNNKQERTLFEGLIKTNGISPKLAPAILSRMSAQQFANTAEREEVGALVRLPGIDERTAERLIVEMKGRFKGLRGGLFTPAADLILASLVSPATDDAEQEAVVALVALGYKPQKAGRMTSKIACPDTSDKALIREALRTAL